MSAAVVITGRRGVGKTTVCQKAVRLAQGAGHRCGGILTLAHEGVRHVVDISSGQSRRLTIEGEEGPVVRVGRFRFALHAVEWANRILNQATPCDLLVIDEIGPLETERGEGLVRAFDVLRAGRYSLALVVVRPRLIARVCERAQLQPDEIAWVTRESRDSWPIEILRRLARQRWATSG